MEAVGVQVSRRPMIEFFRENFEAKGRNESEWLKTLAKDPTLGNLEIIEMFADAQAHENARNESYQNTLNSFGFSHGVMDAIAKRLGLPQGTFLRVTSQDPQEFRSYLPPVPFFLKIPRIVFGDAALGYEIAPVLSSEGEVRDLLARGRRPWIITDRFSNLHETNRAHPFPTWAHDLFHILDLSQMPTEMRQALPAIYDYFSELRPANEAEADLVRQILPNILEGGLTYRNSYEPLFMKIKSSQTSREFQDRVKREIEELLSGP